MSPDVENQPTRTAADALERLLEAETWGTLYAKHRADPDQLAGKAGRFRAALSGLGESYTEEAVCAALLARVGSGSTSTLAAPKSPVPESTPEPEPGLDQRQRDIEQALDAMSGAAASAAAEPATGEAPDREASRVLYRLYDHGVRLTLRSDGQLSAGRDGGLTEVQRELLQEHKAGLVALLSPEVMEAVWAPDLRYVSESLRGRGCAPDGVEARRVRELLNEAQEAYEAREDGLARYRLRRAALVASGRLGIDDGVDL